MILEKMVSQTTNILHLQEKRKETRKSGFSDNKYFTFAPNKTTVVMNIKSFLQQKLKKCRNDQIQTMIQIYTHDTLANKKVDRFFQSQN